MGREPDEYELASQARGGDPEALAEFVERTRLRLFAIAYAELRHYEDAQDAVAAALLQVCLHLRELREPERLGAWMQSIVRNEVRRLRRGAGAPMVHLEEATSRSEEIGPALLRLDIEDALRRLPRQQALALRLFYLDTLSARDIAQCLGRSEGTITSWLHRGRQRLSREMEAYAPMTPKETPPQTAALLHTRLESSLAQRIEAALRAGNHETKVLSTDPPDLEALKECQVIVLDDWVGNRSAFELLMHLKANPPTRDIPVCVLASAPDDFTASAYFTAGVNCLIDKNRADELGKLAGPFEKRPTNPWRLFTERARRMVFYAQEEAARRNGNEVEPEHLLLGLVREKDSVAGRLLEEQQGISLEALQGELDRQVPRGKGKVGEGMQLTPRSKQVVDLAYEEARQLNNDYLGTEHLLLGLIREEEGLAARVLLQLGADLELLRRDVQAAQTA